MHECRLICPRISARSGLENRVTSGRLLVVDLEGGAFQPGQQRLGAAFGHGLDAAQAARFVERLSRELSQALQAIAGGVVSPDDRDRYKALIQGLYDHDWFMVAADFDSYAAAQRDVDALWGRKAEWNAKAIRNVAGMGWFSSDRTIRQYASEIWGVL